MSTKKILIILEQKDGIAKKSSLELITAAGKILSGKNTVVAFTRGDGAGKTADVLGNLGVSKLYLGEGENFSNYVGEVFVDAISGIVSREMPDYIFATANPFGKDLMPRLSAKLNRGYISDCTDILNPEAPLFVKPIFAGKVLADAKIPGEGPVLVSLRPNVFPQPVPGADKKTVEIANASSNVSPASLRIKLKEVRAAKTSKIDLQEASIIVSGGRAMKNAENFNILHDMAQVLGAAVGASRAAVDSEYASQDMQVGQTGKVVNPTIYIACGISGAIQHLAGMRTSKVIVAINKDKDAPIFKFADYGIVGDLFQVVPVMTEEFKKLLRE